MQLILVRHGRPDEHRPEAPHDPPLSDEGWRQAKAAAAFLADEGVSRIIASPLLRARQTAEPLAAHLGMPIETIEGWAEADRGSCQYRSPETIRAEGAEAWARFMKDPVGFLGGDPEAFRAGVIEALRDSLQGAGRSARVVVFAHGLPINVVLSHVLGLESITNFLMGYGSVTRLLTKEDGGLVVSSVNETGHQRSASESLRQ
jgi:probable phosphoglycerate mutase